MNWHLQNLTQLQNSLQQGLIDSVGLTSFFLERISQLKHLNAFLDVQPEISMAQARQADLLIREGKGGPLTGIPIAHKDVFVTKVWKSTAGSKILANYSSPFDATVVERLGLDGAGMVSLGKTNMDEFAMGSSNENSAYGPTLNPWNLERVP
ncbi:MAG: hypothetical protein RIR83_1105, partial [Pseudomonadota bacterium]